MTITRNMGYEKTNEIKKYLDNFLKDNFTPYMREGSSEEEIARATDASYNIGLLEITGIIHGMKK